MIFQRDVLIIEDSLAVATLIHDFLTKLGYQNVHICDKGTTGIQVFEELVKANKMPVILLDYNLPDMTGSDVMTEIFKINPGAKIIIESANERSDESIRKVLQAGAYQYLEKPIRFESLANTMRIFEREDKILENRTQETEKQTGSTLVIPSKTKSLPKWKSNKFLIFSLIGSVTAILISNISDKEFSDLVASSLYVIFPGSLALFSLLLVKKTKSRKDLRLPYILFAIFAVSWFIAEQIWNVSELVLKIDPFPSWGDFFWIIGYVTLLAFYVLLLKPLKDFISKKTLAFAIILSGVYLIPSIMVTYTSSTESDHLEIAVALAYPIGDAIILVPALAGFMIHFRTSKNYFWSTLMIAVILTLITDTIFLFSQDVEIYSLGNPIWLGFHLSYILFSAGAYRQIRILDQEKESYGGQIRKEFDKEKRIEVTSGLVIPLTTTAVIAVISLSLIGIYQFESFSTRQMTIIQPLIYGGIVTAVILSIATMMVSKKLLGVKSRISSQSKKGTEIPETSVDTYGVVLSDDLVILQQKLVKLEKINKKTTLAILAVSVVVASILGFYVYVNFYGSPLQVSQLSSGRFLIQDLKGDTIDTWVSWRIIKGEILTVNIVNADILPKDKVAAIKSAILSKEAAEVKKSPIDMKSDRSIVHYKGWVGALKKAAEQKTAFTIPTKFKITEENKAQGDIVIILSPDREGDGSLGFTRSIADKEQHQILKSTITIFNVEELTNEQLSAITRHEFGHALGLAHSSAPEDLMATKISGTPLISECDIDAIKLLYNDKKSNQVVCKN